MKVLWGVSASVAIYKAAEAVRLLRAEGAEVTVVMTPNATKLLAPRLFEAVTGRRVLHDLFAGEHAFAHLEAAREAHAFAVVPATANVLGKLAAGIADEALTTVALAVNCGRLLAPAMNPKMWEKAEVQRNVATLRENGYEIVPPAEGVTACGDVGAGKLAAVSLITEDILRLANPDSSLSGKKIVVTAGPTREPLDPVRVVTNPSSGLMGYEVARRAARRGAEVILISGSVSDPVGVGSGVKTRRVNSAAEMREATAEAFKLSEALIMAAAVSDYKPDKAKAHKIKKTSANISTTLIPTVDILSELYDIKGNKVVIGFAAETENLLENAKRKLLKKGADIIIANVIGKEGVGFASAKTEAAIVSREKTVELGTITKAELAEKILDELEGLWGGR